MPTLNDLVREQSPEIEDAAADEREAVTDALRRWVAYNQRGRVYHGEEDRLAIRWLGTAQGQAALKRHKPLGWARALFPQLGL